MIKNLKTIALLLISGVALLSSCSKKNYTASFSPSKAVKYNAAAEQEILITEEVSKSEETFASANDEVVVLEKPYYAKPIENTVKNTAISTDKKQIREAKKLVAKELVKSAFKPKNKTNDDMFIIKIILCFFIPPLAVFLHEDAITTNFWIDLILTLLFFLPGVIYALLIVLDAI